jgi:hypothetical protein
MASKPALLLATLALTILAGCSSAPPSGDLVSGSAGLAVDGNVAIDYTQASYPAGQVPQVGNQLCPPPEAPVPQCVPAASSFGVHFMALPTPDSNGYHAFLVGSAGERDLGALVMDEGNMYELAVNYTEDLTDQYQSVELRMGTFVFATASAAEGTQAFALAGGLTAVSATGSYRGKVLNVTVSGLPEGASYNGHLYTLDEESGLLTRGPPFPIRNGANEHEAELDIEDYAEFHIHVGTSSVNLVKSTIPQ